MVLHEVYFKVWCETCCKQYTDSSNKWCKPCQIDYLKTIDIISGNEKIDNLIQEMQLKINRPQDIVFEWIPYNQFTDIGEIFENGFAKVYSTKWKNGPLKYNRKIIKYERDPNKKVTLFNSQNTITNEFLNNEV
jgi:hypothetical protein